jgi:UDP-N-acetylglucosamine 2-epimerase (non-hydrolysing)
MKRMMVIIGTRPEAVKLAPLVLGLRDASGFEPFVVATGQHREMLDQVLDVFGITPDTDLDVLRDRQSLAEVTSRVLARLDPVVGRERPDAMIVQGDTTSTLVGALAGFYHRLPVVHVEAGLRTGDRWSPYPEEVNRRLTTQLTTLHLAPTATSQANLLAEGIDPAAVIVTGNTVIDALIWTVEQSGGYGDPALADLDDNQRPVLLVTAHRRESWGKGMAAIGQALAEIARAEPDLLVIFPVHKNPVVRDAVLPPLRELANVRVVEPLPYGGFAHLMRRSTVLLTDSGGMQEEGPSLGKPVLVMRSTTERPEAVAAGTVRLVGTDQRMIVDSVLELLRDKHAYQRMSTATNPYGDGRAVYRTLGALEHLFEGGPRPEEFRPA